jgi:hypothetical protein
VDATLAQIVRLPRAGARVPRVPIDLPVRRAPVKRFPYHVIYLDVKATIRVLAVAHDRRMRELERAPLEERRGVMAGVSGGATSECRSERRTVAFLVPDRSLSRRGYRPVGACPVFLGVILSLSCVRDFYVSGKGPIAPWAPAQKLVVTDL